ncbi:hypothetical protein VNO77_11053 [Canavalia gladiata]|uniref:Uncharacterized protein n=1 Tax=Canavalia gladiata TaxID=3824 RepID=A0AAN9MB28_CANGL
MDPDFVHMYLSLTAGLSTFSRSAFLLWNPGFDVFYPSNENLSFLKIKLICFYLFISLAIIFLFLNYYYNYFLTNIILIIRYYSPSLMFRKMITP